MSVNGAPERIHEPIKINTGPHTIGRTQLKRYRAVAKEIGVYIIPSMATKLSEEEVSFVVAGVQEDINRFWDALHAQSQEHGTA